MQRAAVLWRASPARVVVALFALMLAAAMAVGSGANFNSTSANIGNTVTAGILKHTNSKNRPGHPERQQHQARRDQVRLGDADQHRQHHR